MRGTAKRFILIGLDGFQLPMARRFAAEGRLPNIRRLLERGSSGELIPCLPCWTPTNWGTIATGAYPSPPARDLYLLVKGQPNPLVKTFIRWILGSGQAFADTTGYVSLPKERLAAGKAKLK